MDLAAQFRTASASPVNPAVGYRPHPAGFAPAGYRKTATAVRSASSSPRLYDHNRKCLPRRNAEGHIAKNPILVGWLLRMFVAEPHVPELNFSTWRHQLLRLRIGINRDRLVQQLENAFGSGHCRLQDIEFLAQVLNGTEKSLRVHCKGGKYAQRQGAMENAVAARPINQPDRRKA